MLNSKFYPYFFLLSSMISLESSAQRSNENRPIVPVQDYRASLGSVGKVSGLYCTADRNYSLYFLWYDNLMFLNEGEDAGIMIGANGCQEPQNLDQFKEHANASYKPSESLYSFFLPDPLLDSADLNNEYGILGYMRIRNKNSPNLSSQNEICSTDLNYLKIIKDPYLTTEAIRLEDACGYVFYENKTMTADQGKHSSSNNNEGSGFIPDQRPPQINKTDLRETTADFDPTGVRDGDTMIDIKNKNRNSK